MPVKRKMSDENSSNSNSNSSNNKNEEINTRVAKQQQQRRRQNNGNNNSSKNESSLLTSLLLRRPIISMLISIVVVYGLGHLYENNPTTHYLLSSLSSLSSSRGRGRGSSRATSRSIAKARKKRLLYGANDAVFGYIEEQHAGSGSTKIPFGSVLDAGTGPQSLRWIATLAGDDADTTQNQKKGNKGKGMTDFTAVTADETMRKNVQREMEQLGISSQLGTVVIGNWFPSSSSSDSDDDDDDDEEEGGVDNSIRQLQRQQQNSGDDTSTTTTQKQYYDTIIADYLIGAMEGFSPYKQDLMIDKLASYLKPPTGIITSTTTTTTTDGHEQQQQQHQQPQRGGRLYIIGLEPMPDSYDDGIHGKESPQNLICELRRIRHACILLAGQRPYREYPYEWVKRRIMYSTTVNQDKNSSSASSSSSLSNANANQLQMIDSQTFPIYYHHSTILRQINDVRSKLPHFPSPTLANEMSKVLDQLEKRSSDYFTDNNEVTTTTTASSSSNNNSSISPSQKTIELGFDYV